MRGTIQLKVLPEKQDKLVQVLRDHGYANLEVIDPLVDSPELEEYLSKMQAVVFAIVRLPGEVKDCLQIYDLMDQAGLLHPEEKLRKRQVALLGKPVDLSKLKVHK